jgi:hypothetical protein
LFSSDELNDLRLEEVNSPSPVLQQLAELAGPRLERVYKTLQIDAETGKLLSMKIRQNESSSVPQIG